MAVMEQGAPIGMAPRLASPLTAVILTLAGAAAGLIILILQFFVQSALPSLALAPILSIVALSLFAAAFVFTAAGGIFMLVRPGLGGSMAIVGALFWLAGCINAHDIGYAQAVPILLPFLGAVTALISSDTRKAERDVSLVYKQSGWTRVTHWVWAVTMFFMLLSGLQIFNSRPNLYIGQQSGFGFDNSILDFGLNQEGTLPQYRIFGHVWDAQGYHGTAASLPHSNFNAIPGWATIPSFHDLGSGRVVHFFFAWILVGTLAVWLISALASGHLWRDIVLKPRDFRELPADIVAHVLLRFNHTKSYSPLQKIAYFGVFVILFPLIILTGLTMSPGMDAAWPWLVDLFGGRQTARTIHFFTMVAFVLFFIVHIIMVVLANPINELRSMITGYYKTNTHLKRGSSGEEH